LLDVNVLVALLDAQHVAHARAHAWLAQSLTEGWASCPITENGCVRVLTNPRYPAPVAATEVLTKLATAKSSGRHLFWPDDISLTDTSLFDCSQLLGHQQVTDAYLLGLAVKHGGRLVTFDSGISPTIVTGAHAENLTTI
jgi:toxin-antitoxin system PIN domain toxin